MTLRRKYRCSFCGKEFTRETWYKKHTCEKKKRFLNSNNIHYISGHRLFNHWQEKTGLMKKGKTKPMDDFMRSPYFNSFVNLATFVHENNIISGYKYIDWLVDSGLKEAQWRDKSRLEQFRDYVRRSEEPTQQVEDTCKFIIDWCEEREQEPGMFFERITPGQALTMVRHNQISPWVLFCYDGSVDGLVPRLTGEVLYALDDHIKINYWLTKIESEKDSAVMVQERCEVLLNERRDT